MIINKHKHIGRVLFIVEGSKTEFSLLRRIFCNLLNYTYIEKRRNRPDFFISLQDKYSKVAVINTYESNIKDISENEDFVSCITEHLQEKYNFPIDRCAIFYLFDRDPLSNLNQLLIKNFLKELVNPYDNPNYNKAGQLLLSYPSIESYIISNFINDTKDLRFNLGTDLKTFIGQHPQIQINKISETTLSHSTDEFISFLASEGIINFNIDDFSNISIEIFDKQEANYQSGRKFKLFSMLTLAFLQLGIIEMN